MKIRSEDSHCASVRSSGVWIKFRSKSLCLASCHCAFHSIKVLILLEAVVDSKLKFHPWARHPCVDWTLRGQFLIHTTVLVIHRQRTFLLADSYNSRVLECTETKQRQLPPFCLLSPPVSSRSTCLLDIPTIYIWGICDQQVKTWMIAYSVPWS